MALVTMKELLERAKNNHRGIGAFSVGNMEMVKGAIQAAEELEKNAAESGVFEDEGVTEDEIDKEVQQELEEAGLTDSQQ